MKALTWVVNCLLFLNFSACLFVAGLGFYDSYWRLHWSYFALGLSLLWLAVVRGLIFIHQVTIDD